MATGVLFGVAPALHMSRVRLAGVLNDNSRGTTAHRLRQIVRRGLVAAQLALAVVLVIGAGLLVRTLVALNRVDLGFDPRHVLTAQLQLPPGQYPDAASVNGFYRQLTERLAEQPGIVAAGAIRIVPLSRSIGDWSITIEGRPAGPNENPNADYQIATPGYFEAMKTTLVAGRLLTSADHEQGPLAAVINDTMASRYWPGQSAVGRRFQMGGTGTALPPIEVVGVVRTSRHDAVVEEPRAEMYLPHAQIPRAVGGPARNLGIVVRTEADPLASVAALRSVVRDLDSNLPVADVQSMEQIAARALAGPRFAAMLLVLLGLLALGLASIGTYATISLLVAERAPEIGIRLALGADRLRILRAVVGEGLALAIAGVVVGSAVAAVLTRALGDAPVRGQPVRSGDVCRGAGIVAAGGARRVVHAGPACGRGRPDRHVATRVDPAAHPVRRAGLQSRGPACDVIPSSSGHGSEDPGCELGRAMARRTPAGRCLPSGRMTSTPRRGTPSRPRW